MPGVYDPAFTTGSDGKCLTNKGWEYERPIFGAARRINKLLVDYLRLKQKI